MLKHPTPHDVYPPPLCCASELAGSYLQQYLNRDQYSSGSPSKATSPSPTASQSRVAQLRGDGYATLQRMNSDQIRTQEFLHESIHSRLANPKYWSGKLMRIFSTLQLNPPLLFPKSHDQRRDLLVCVQVSLAKADSAKKRW